jgi:hypothetical protein
VGHRVRLNSRISASTSSLAIASRINRDRASVPAPAAQHRSTIASRLGERRARHRDAQRNYALAFTPILTEWIPAP